MASKYKFEMDNGDIINVPRDAAKTEYENYSKYGFQAALERARRTRAYAKAKADRDGYIRAIIFPNGDRVTQF